MEVTKSLICRVSVALKWKLPKSEVVLRIKTHSVAGRETLLSSAKQGFAARVDKMRNGKKAANVRKLISSVSSKTLLHEIWSIEHLRQWGINRSYQVPAIGISKIKYQTS